MSVGMFQNEILLQKYYMCHVRSGWSKSVSKVSKPRRRRISKRLLLTNIKPIKLRNFIYRSIDLHRQILSNY